MESVEECKRSQVILAFKPVIFAGKFLGVLPSGNYNSNQNQHRKILGYVFPGALVISTFSNVVLETNIDLQRISSHSDAFEKLQELLNVGYTLAVFFTYIYLLWRTRKLEQIITRLSDLYLSPGRKNSFVKFSWISLTSILILAILDNAFYDIQSLQSADSSDGNSTLEKYYWKLMYPWHSVLPYNSIATLIWVVTNKLETYAVVYGDILVIVLCRAMVEKLKDIHHEMKNSLVEVKTMKYFVLQKHLALWDNNPASSTSTWDKLYYDYLTLEELISEVETIVAPLVLSCYGINVSLIIINLFLWISPNMSFNPEQTFYTYYAFAYFSFRVASVTYFAGEVYHVGRKLRKILQSSPNTLYTLSIERLERSLLWNPCGISLFGTFMITRKFFISIISFVFTTEIVLLQAANGKTPETGSANCKIH